MTQMATEILTDFELLEEHEFEVPCDYASRYPDWCSGGAAKWIGYGRCGCGFAGHRLLCDQCKDMILSTSEGMRCPECDTPHIPVRHLFVRFESLKRA